MRLLLDATAIPADRGGVGRYIDGLVPALVDAGVDLVVACQPRDAASFAAADRDVEVVPAPRAVEAVHRRFAWEQTGLPQLARRVRADVIHSPHYTMPVAAGRPVVVTLHDATFYTHPELHLPAKARFFRLATRHAVRRAASIVVPTEATSREVARHTSLDPGKVHVARHGVDHARFRPSSGVDVERVRASLGLVGRPYIAFLGTLEPRKNVPALIDGWVEAYADADPSVAPALVLAGGAGWDTGVEPAAARVPAHLRLVRPGYLPLDDLPAYLAGAAVVAYPSTAEGFGLPVLEAMACGATVLTTRDPALREVGGDAVAYTEPNAPAIAVALRSLLDDAARRQALSHAATARAAAFTWDAAARGHLAAYEAAAAAGR